MRRVRYVVLPIILFALAGPSRGTDGHDFRACPGHRLAYTFARLEVPGTFGVVRAINNAGRVVGNFYDESGLAHAFLFSRGEFTQLVDLPGFTTPEPFGMNEAGQIVGLDWDRGRGVFWRTSTAAPIELETLGGNGSLGYAVNNSGQIVGYADLPGNVRRAAIWRHGGAAPTELGSLGGSDNAAFSINNRGQIVGLGTLPDNTGFRALWWQNSDTPPLDLGTLEH